MPAWLPNKPTMPVEDSIVEFLQLALLFGSAAFFFAAAPHAKKMKPVFRIFGFIAILVTLSEHDLLINHVINPIEWIWFLVVAGILIVARLFKHQKAFRSFIALATRTPASGFLGAALILVYLFSNIFGSNEFWLQALGQTPPDKLASTLREYLELLACYFVFVATAGFCLPLTKRH